MIFLAVRSMKCHKKYFFLHSVSGVPVLSSCIVICGMQVCLEHFLKSYHKKAGGYLISGSSTANSLSFFRIFISSPCMAY